jgi:hydroxyethylthiazole kinase-like uncharacterized protein yjeF
VRLVTIAQMRAVEAAAEEAGISPSALLIQAGTAVADRLAALHGRGRHGLVLAGKGNNGGDALVAARRLVTNFGWSLTVVVTPNRAVDGHLSALQTPDLVGRVTISVSGSAQSQAVLDRELATADVIVDGILGIGSSGPMRGEAGQILHRCAEVTGPPGQARVAVDIPSGVDADTGAALDCAFRATRTLSTGPAKPGCFVGDGSAFAGHVEVLDIGLPDVAWPRPLSPDLTDDGSIRRIGALEAATALPVRSDHSHKGSFGRLLIVGGCARYPGAPVLSSFGAIHGGAGVVSVARPSGVVGVALPAEAVAVPMRHGADFLELHDVDAIVQAAARTRAIVIGPGLGDHHSTVAAVRAIVAGLGSAVPMVVDADGLNALAGDLDGRNATWVVTPHAAEMARITGMSIGDVLRDPLGIARASARRWGVVVVLKGAPTVIASPRGSIVIGAYANAALATAGSGDVLAGLIGALLAQGASPWDAAIAGVTIHAVAGEMWRREHGGSGARASDLAARTANAHAFLARMR